MKRTLILFLLILICVFVGGCQGNQPKGNDVQGSNISSTQSADTAKAKPTPAESPASNPAPFPVNAEKITEAKAIERVAKIIGAPPKGYYLEIDHQDSVNGRNYYIVHYYEVVIDDPKTGVGHTATYGWYYVDKENGDVMEMDIATGELMKPTKPNDILQDQQVSYKTYTNGRFGFSIEYPDTFVKEVLPENGDGINLSLPDGSVELTVSGMNNVIVWTLDSLYDSLEKEHNPSYKIKADNWLVVSWTEGDKIIYQKSVVGQGSIDTFIFKYPLNQKEAYNSIVEHLNSTFKTPSINEIH